MIYNIYNYNKYILCDSRVFSLGKGVVLQFSIPSWNLFAIVPGALNM